jgi:hypothetical protein
VILSNSSSFNDVAQAIIGETQRRGYTPIGSIACVSTGIQESGLSPTIVDPTGHVGIYQQDGGYPGRNNANTQIMGFLDRLDAKRASAGASPDIWLNIFWLQQRPGETSADNAYANGRQAYLTEIKSHTAQASQLYDQFATGAQPVTDPNRPAYNEFAKWSPNAQDRAGTKIDLFLLHTQEGGGGNSAAEDLANFLDNPASQVSYHYSISQASDGGVTVVDVVPTAQASWSVLSANDRSINLCFAGSSVNWTRAQWMGQANAIDVAAYLAVQDCKKYGIGTNVVPPPYNTGTPGISDHYYVTKILGDGTHVDVGNNFPWDVFAAAVNKYAAPTPAPSPTPPGPNVPQPPQFPQPPPTTDAMIEQIWGALFNAVPSESRYATQGGLYMTKDFINFTDARLHEVNVERLALMGEPSCVALVKTAAAAGDSIAALVLAKIPAAST